MRLANGGGGSRRPFRPIDAVEAHDTAVFSISVVLVGISDGNEMLKAAFAAENGYELVKSSCDRRPHDLYGCAWERPAPFPFKFPSSISSASSDTYVIQCMNSTPNPTHFHSSTTLLTPMKNTQTPKRQQHHANHRRS